MARGVQQGQVGAGAGGDPADVRRGAGPRAPPAVADQTASSGVMPMSRTARAMQNGIEEVKDEPGLQSVDSATVAPASRRRRASGYVGAGGELRAGQQGGDRVAVRQGVHVGVGEVGAVVGGGRVQLDGELDAGAVGELVGVDARDAGPCALPAVRIARAWSPSKAPFSQKTSIQRAYGAQASSISPVTRST